jgi:hypothetical protein
MPRQNSNPLMTLHKVRRFNQAHLLVLEKLAAISPEAVPEFEIWRHVFDNHPEIRRKVGVLSIPHSRKVAREILKSVDVSSAVTRAEQNAISEDALFDFHEDMFDRFLQPHLTRLIEQGIVVEDGYQMFRLDPKFQRSHVNKLLAYCKSH